MQFEENLAYFDITKPSENSFCDDLHEKPVDSKGAIE